MEKKQIPEGTIRAGEKVAFALANLGSVPYMGLITAFLMIFYTDIVGLNPAAVATLFLITRILDAFNDPIMGFVVDHLPRTKMGRFRGCLLIGVIVCSLNYLLVWFGPLWIPAGKIVIAYVSYILIGITYDLMDIPLQSLVPVMTDVDKERNSLAGIKSIVMLAGGASLAVAVPLIIEAIGDAKSAYTIVIFSAVVITLLFVTIGALGVRERVQPVNDEKYKLRDIFAIITVGPVLATFVSNLFFGTANAIVNTSNIFFFTYILDNRLDVMSLMSIIAVPGTLIAILVSGFLARKFGKKNIYVVGAFMMAGGLLLRLLNVTNVPLLLATNAIIGIGLGFQTPLASTVNADNIDCVEYLRGQRAEGGITSLTSFINKSGSAIGGAISGYVLALTGYIANVPQTDTAKFGILTNTIIIPAALFFLAGIVFAVAYKIDNEKLNEIKEALRARREKKEITEI